MEILQSGVQQLGLALNAEQIKQFETYANLLVEWNQRINLTAVSDLEGIQVKHFLDSLALVQVIPGELAHSHTLDVGSGAGLPGIPLKIIWPDLKLTLMDG